ncbi:MAG: hypothetical protein Q9172_004717 [Xanthocarpia lactea]
MAGADDELPEDQRPVLQDDGLPEADPEDALQDVDFHIDIEDYKTCPDYDPEQDATEAPGYDPEQDATQCPGLPEDLKPVLQDDGLAEADPEDALQDVDFEYDEEDHKTCPDYDPEQDATQCPDFDPEQDATQGIQQRLMVRAGRSKASTILPRKIKIDGKGYRAAFVDSADRRSIPIKGMKPSPHTKESKVGLFESKSLLPRLKDKDGNQLPPLRQTHVDHITDLGILTELGNLIERRCLSRASL